MDAPGCGQVDHLRGWMLLRGVPIVSAKTFWLIVVAIVILGPFWVAHEIKKAVRRVYRWILRASVWAKA